MERFATTCLSYNPRFNSFGPPAPEPPPTNYDEASLPTALKPTWKLIDSFVVPQVRQVALSADWNTPAKIVDETNFMFFWFWENMTPPVPL